MPNCKGCGCVITGSGMAEVTHNGHVIDIHVPDVAGAIEDSPADLAIATAITTSGTATNTVLNNTFITEAQADTDYAPALVSGKAPVRKDELFINAKDYGAIGNGVATGNQVAINAAIVAAAGGTVYVPAGIYLIDATAGIKMWTANVRLLLSPGAIIRAQPNNASGYMMIEVNAADCVIEGGTVEGDGTGHTGVTGEQGHCIVTAAGAHRLRVENVKVTKAWGDGITIQSNPSDVAIINCTAVDNRRQGMSIIQAVRPRVLGGHYMDTGLSQNTAPSAGIDVEPNGTNQVVDAQIVGVTFSGNRGPGLQVAAATGGLAEVTVIGCKSVDSVIGSGFYAVGPTGTIRAKVSGMHSEGNVMHGFTLLTTGVELASCTASRNTQHGFMIQEDDSSLTACWAIENGRVGYQIAASTVENTNLVACGARANSQTTSGGYVNFDNSGVGTRMTACISDAGILTNKPAWGYLLRASSTARLESCDSRGTYTSGVYSDGSGAGNSVAFPVPGVAKQTLAAAATDAATTQTLANSLRTALINLGWGA